MDRSSVFPGVSGLWWNFIKEGARTQLLAQEVVWRRSIGLATGVARPAEVTRMLSEKAMAAVSSAQNASLAAICGGGIAEVAEAASIPYRRTVRANVRRLRG